MNRSPFIEKNRQKLKAMEMDESTELNSKEAMFAWYEKHTCLLLERKKPPFSFY